MIRRLAILIYAGFAYVIALASLAYLVGFLADFGVPKGINDGPPGLPWLRLASDLFLIGLFGLHHSIAARRWFKARLTRDLPPAIERATYLISTALMTAILVTFWQPISITLWRIEAPAVAGAIVALYLLAWTMMFAATFHFGHFGFFGWQQAWDRFRERRARGTSFSARYLYALVRHPISLGWILVPWLTPHMTAGQLVFALGVLAYVLIATPFEEADLIEELGDDYRAYRSRVPAFVLGSKIARPSECRGKSKNAAAG